MVAAKVLPRDELNFCENIWACPRQRKIYGSCLALFFQAGSGYSLQVVARCGLFAAIPHKLRLAMAVSPHAQTRKV